MKYKSLLVKVMGTSFLQLFVILVFALSSFFGIATVKAQTPITITGKITELTGEPIPGVSVKIKNSTRGASTNENGQFTITVDNAQVVLVFSSVGFEPVERAVGKDRVINIALKTNDNKLNEVIIVGYGTQKREYLTGSTARADLESFKNAPNANFVQMLQGTVAGLNVGQVNTAGQTPSLQVRGQNTLSGNQDVLIVLDGIQYNGSLQSINPDDIESVDILKDASSTAVYGAQAANGVILVTTKKGKTQKPRVSFSSSYATQEPRNSKLRPMKPDEYLEHVRMLYYQQAYLAPDYLTPNPTFDLIAALDPSNRAAASANTPYDWWDESTQVGHIFDNRLSVNGGSENYNYLLSFNSTDQEGFIVNDIFKRKTARANLETKVAPWWSIGLQSFATFINKDGQEPTLADLTRASPFISPFKADGELNQNPDGTVAVNPYFNQFVDDQERDNFFFANLYTDIKFPFLKGLSYRLNYGNNYRIFKRYRFSKYAQNQTGEAFKNHTFYNDYTFDNILTYKRTFGKHNVEATLLYGLMERNNQNTTATGRQFSRFTLGYDAIQQAGIQLITSDDWKDQQNYQMARLNYIFNDRYILTGTVRRDGYSGFAESHKWGVFPSISAAWIISKEKFMKSASWVKFLKLRGGYGISGNQTPRYSSLARVSSGAVYVFGDGSGPSFGQQQTSMPNADLKWEKSAGANIGIDFELLKGSRISGNIDVYNNVTKDLLYAVSIPYATGYAVIQSNVGELRNRGIDLSVTGKVFANKKFGWHSTVTLSSNSNRIISLLGQDKNGDGIEDDLTASGLFINRPVGAIYGYQTDGFYQIGDPLRTGYFPGTYRIVDQNGDDLIGPATDRVILGSPEPAYRLSWLNNFRYGNFNLSVFVNSVQGGSSGYLAGNSNPIQLNDNTVRWNYLSGMDYWQPNNPNASNQLSPVLPAISPVIYRDRSFVRLQDISLSYRFAPKILKSLYLQNLSVFVSGKNLVTWTDWKGWDPETGQGMVVDGRPVLKSVSVGLSASF
ncbi:SusC/RagA family TonB-linked outer membrane protein [Pedobacter frigiditerrae]|uniref:SusC/RagA family TonB-linked outer membrane protein n=1 Tax=Pedobacter frigiditerrae TaxID=2530452 RepID=UPI00292FE945|nr:SusC/RagA family TonB-linked outer membrane protein [Pedobacter frigiditerrae]